MNVRPFVFSEALILAAYLTRAAFAKARWITGADVTPIGFGGADSLSPLSRRFATDTNEPSEITRICQVAGSNLG